MAYLDSASLAFQTPVARFPVRSSEGHAHASGLVMVIVEKNRSCVDETILAHGKLNEIINIIFTLGE